MGPAHHRAYPRILNLLLSVAPTFLGLTCVTFLIGRIIPIDPALAIVGDKASRATYDLVAAEIGVNLPIPVRCLALSEEGAAHRVRATDPDAFGL